jgi:hypothetical protein
MSMNDAVEARWAGIFVENRTKTDFQAPSGATYSVRAFPEDAAPMGLGMYLMSFSTYISLLRSWVGGNAPRSRALSAGL